MKNTLMIFLACILAVACTVVDPNENNNSSNNGNNNSNTGGTTGSAENTNELCSDGIDNDGNGFTDCEDFDCLGDSAITVCPQEWQEGDPASNCTDNIDNDNNSFVDCEDFACLYGCVDACTDLAEKSAEDCQDGIDNDGDGYVDCDDNGCKSCVDVCENTSTGGNGEDENTNELCSDGIDNDGNGFTDCDDFSCSRNSDVTVCPEEWNEGDDAGVCTDNVDNDGNGYTDCEDFACLYGCVDACTDLAENQRPIAATASITTVTASPIATTSVVRAASTRARIPVATTVVATTATPR